MFPYSTHNLSSLVSAPPDTTWFLNLHRPNNIYLAITKQSSPPPPPSPLYKVTQTSFITSPSIQTLNPQPKMVSLETIQPLSKSVELNSSPRISFSAEFLDEKNFISITPKSPAETERERARNADFEFLSSNLNIQTTMLTADELFFEGKLLPFWQMQNSERLSKISLKEKDGEALVEEGEVKMEESNRVSWFVDEDPSPRPPKCTVLWKELLRLRKQRPSSLSPSSSSSSSTSSSFGYLPPIEEGKEGREKHVKRIKKGLERTRSTSIRIRPMINVPICTQGKSNSLPTLSSLKKGRVER